MTTAINIDLSNTQNAYLSYKYQIENADNGEYLQVLLSDDGGWSFVEVELFFGNESGTSNIDLSTYISLTSQVKLRAVCLVSQSNESCSWDDIKIASVDNPGGNPSITVVVPQPDTYVSSDFPLPYSVDIGNYGSVEYVLDGASDAIQMTGEDGEFGTTFTAVEGWLPSGDHTFEVFATNTQENSNVDNVVFSVDNTIPAIEFVDPTPLDGSDQIGSAIEVKLSTNFGLDHYSFVEFDGDLYLWLRMDDVIDDIVVDSSPYLNDGLIEGHAVRNPSGKFGSAFEFDGINHGGDIPTDRILIPGFQDRHQIFDTSFTAMAWAKPDVSEKMVILGNTSITNLPGWHLRTSGGSHKLRMGVNTGYTNATHASAQAPNPMVAKKWVHVVGIYDSTVPQIQLYLDGELIDTESQGISPFGYSNNLDLAVAMPEDPQKAWDGLVDEVLIFGRVLNASEIRAIYDSTVNQYQNTYTGLDAGFHEFTGYSVNAIGNQEQTETRSVSIE